MPKSDHPLVVFLILKFHSIPHELIVCHCYCDIIELNAIFKNLEVTLMEFLIFFMILILLCHPLVLSFVTYTWLTIKGLLLFSFKTIIDYIWKVKYKVVFFLVIVLFCIDLFLINMKEKAAFVCLSSNNLLKPRITQRHLLGLLKANQICEL